MKTIIRSILFLIPGIILFCCIQNVVRYKWEAYLQDPEYSGHVFSELAELKKESVEIQAFFLGTSHGRYGIDPMQIYDDYGIVTYNLSTCAQPIEGSYYLLKNLIHDFHPKIIFFDASGLFTERREDSHHHIILDNIGYNPERFEYAVEYAKLSDDASFDIKRFKDAIFPFYQYHSRWKSLQNYDFSPKDQFNFFLKGYFLVNSNGSAEANLQGINEIAYKNNRNYGFTYILSDDKPVETLIDKGLIYAPEVSERNYDYLKRMDSLCNENGIQLVLMKIHAINYPQYYNGTWTEIKSEMVKNISAQLRIPFLDLLYDYDLQIDWATDSVDSGAHLNYKGVRKISDFLGNYLANRTNAVPMGNAEYEKDLAQYYQMSFFSGIQTTSSFKDYLRLIGGLSGKTILISADDDMRSSLDEEGISLLHELGLKSDFEHMQYSDAYIAVINNGKVEYEAVSNRRIEYETMIGNDVPCKITSAGWMVGNESQILINGTNVSGEKRGINIVVFDNESGLVWDSVSFDTWASADPAGERDLQQTNLRASAYMEYLMKKDGEAKN